MNNIYKKIWNKLRGCFVAVSEAVGSKQARGKAAVLIGSALIVGSGQTFAETMTDGGSLSGSYDNLTLGGDRGTVNVGTFQTAASLNAESGANGVTIQKGGNRSGSRQSSLPSWFARTDWDTNTLYGYRINGIGSLSWNEFQTAFNNYLAATIPDSVINAVYTVDTDQQLTVTGSLTLGKISQTSSATVWYIEKHSEYVNNSSDWGGDSGYDYLVSHISANATKTHSVDVQLVNNGGNVDIIGDLILENPENTYTQNGGSTSIDGIGGEGSVIINDGTLSTSGGVLIDISEAKAADIGAYELFDSSKAITVTSLAAGEKSKVSGMSAQSDQFTINGGTLNIEGTYEQHIADQAEQLLKDYYGQNINVTFDEIVADQTLDLSNGYTTAVLNSIYDENGRGDVLFHSINWNAQDQNLVIGDGDMVRNIGVKNIDNAASVTVTNGKTFAILGDGTGTTVNGVFTADNGNLVFGAAGLTSGGTVSSVSMLNNANVTVANGAFVFGSLTGQGNFSVAQTGSADLSDYFVNGRFTNDGSTTISGELTFADGSEMTSSGNLTTGLDNVFENVTPSVDDPLKVIGLNASLPEEVRSVATELFQKYVPGDVASDLAEHAMFSGGKVTITGVDLTETQRDDLTQAFKEQIFSRDSQANAFPVALL